VLDYPPQPVITKDNVAMQIDTVVYFSIRDPKLYSYGVDNPMMAMETLTATTLRNIIGELELDDTLTSRETINSRMRSELDEATDPWGIKVNRVELKNIMPPRDIQEAMERQMRAEREKRESILRAEGERQSAILQAEGEKEAAILRAEAKKIEMVREAEGHSESIRLHKQAEAEGILKLQQAEANAIAMLKEAGLSTDEIVRLRSFDAFKIAADGQATKIIIPSDIQNITSLVAGVKESAQ
jgi:regulator of protease activity HflC (stomatin/prohibitin superfamily)